MTLGWVPQDLALYPRLSCRENLGSFGLYHGLRGHYMEEAERLCDRITIIDHGRIIAVESKD